MSSITQVLQTIMEIDPARAEICFEDREYSWGDLARVVAAIESALDELTLPADTRVGIMLRNRPGHIAAIVAVLARDCCIVTLNPSLPEDKLVADIVGLSLPVVIGDDTDIARRGMAEAFAQTGTAVIAIGPRLEGAKLVQRRANAEGHIATSPGVAIEMLSSGTTGTPKRIPLSRASFEDSFAGFARYGKSGDHRSGPRLRSGVTLVINPLTHIGGIYGCIAALLNGRTIVLLERFTVEGWCLAVKRYRPLLAPAVPSAVRMLLEADIDRADLSSLSGIISGTAPLAPELVDAFFEKYGVPILGNYGATEFAGAVAGWTLEDFNGHWAQKRGAVGRVQSNIAARVVNAETGAVLPAGAEGLLELKGDQLGAAYTIAGDNWLRTTDRAVLDDDNFLFIRGRADNAIIRGGFKVHPDDIVKVLNCHPALREAAVVGVSDDRLGAVPAAAMILKEGATAPAIEDLKDWLKQRLIAYQVPVHFRYVDDFPRTPSMKPSTAGLQALFTGQG